MSLLLEYFLYLIWRQRYAWIDTADIVSQYTRNESGTHNQRDNDGRRNQGKFVSQVHHACTSCGILISKFIACCVTAKADSTHKSISGCSVFAASSRRANAFRKFESSFWSLPRHARYSAITFSVSNDTPSSARAVSKSIDSRSPGLSLTCGMSHLISCAIFTAAPIKYGPAPGTLARRICPSSSPPP